MYILYTQFYVQNGILGFKKQQQHKPRLNRWFPLAAIDLLQIPLFQNKPSRIDSNCELILQRNCIEYVNPESQFDLIFPVGRPRPPCPYEILFVWIRRRPSSKPLLLFPVLPRPFLSK